MAEPIENNSTGSRKFCSIPGCRKRGGRMYYFPKCAKRRDQWRLACQLSKVTKSMNICPEHFSPNDFYTTAKGYVYVKKDASPSIFPPKFEPLAPLYCIVPQCGLSPKDEVTLHRFPRNLNRRRAWQVVCGLTICPSPNTKICCLHFLPNDFRITNGKKVLKSSAVPRLLLPGNDTEVANHDDHSTRCDDRQSGENGSSECTEVAPEETEADWNKESSVLCPEHSSLSVSYDDYNSSSDCADRNPSPISQSDISFPSSTINPNHCGSLKSVINNLAILNEPTSVLSINHSDGDSDGSEDTDNIVRNVFSNKLYKSCQTDVFTILQLVKNDSQLKSVAGVTFSLLNCLEKWIMRLTNGQQKSKFPIREKIVLTLAKLRLNISFDLLAVYFGIDSRQCSAYFWNMLPLLAEVLKKTIYWPTLEEIRTNMSKCFSAFPNSRLVLDCTEIPVDSPDCLKCHIRLYSHYKKCLTVKFLVGLAPSGLIIFISNAYGGKASDKLIFKESILVKEGMLKPFIDEVMVDKGFRIDKVCEENNIKIIRPPFLTKKQQLSTNEAVLNAEIDNARVHVELAIQRLKIFQILEHKISWNMVPHINTIMSVIVGITNLSETITAEHRYLQND